jgi:transcriptional regulator with XRE-family HTH domain/uncharacterized protein YceK
MMTHKAFVKKILKEPAVKAEYDAQAEEFALLDELLKARRQAGLTQAEVAARMGTKTPAVARLEAGGGSQRHSPSVATLRKYANQADRADRGAGCGQPTAHGPWAPRPLIRQRVRIDMPRNHCRMPLLSRRDLATEVRAMKVRAGFGVALAVAATCTLSGCGSFLTLSGCPVAGQVLDFRSDPFPPSPYYAGVRFDANAAYALFKDTDHNLPFRMMEITAGTLLIVDVPLSAYIDTCYLPLIALEMLFRKCGITGPNRLYRNADPERTTEKPSAQ